MNDITYQSINDIVHDFNLEIKQNPDIINAYCTRGLLKFCLKDIEGAFTDWSKATQMGCKNTIILINYLTLA